MFFIIPGLIIGAFSLYVNFWMLMHYIDALEVLRSIGEPADFDGAFKLAYQQHSHTFIFGLLTAMLAVQLIGLGILALQNKQYFDELFDLGSQARRNAYRISKR